MKKFFEEIRKKTREDGNLIHSITSPIAINDCANVVLLLGAKPIMAEHPMEVADITSVSKALTVSYANITDARRESIRISGQRAKDKGIPIVIDVVGITCSRLRMEEVRSFIAQCKPTVIKGNISEIKALLNLPYENSGIDVSKMDALGKDNREALISFAQEMKKYAALTGAILVATGEVDVIVGKEKSCFVYNGSPYMAKLTGTGCMLTCILGTYLGSGQNRNFAATILSVLTMGIAGEMAAEHTIWEGKNGEWGLGMGSYHMNLLDSLSLLTDVELVSRADYEVF